ncbi:MAG: HAD family hydrolase [Bacteroidota bacterium]
MKSIIFDFYGTLAEIKRKTNPYKKLLTQEGKGSTWFMTRDFDSIQAVKKALNIQPDKMNGLEAEIYAELASVQLFEEVEGVLDKLSKNRELYLLSNLASPYKKPFNRLKLNRWISQAFFSCEIGLLKPSAEAFTFVLHQINKKPGEVVMIGDSYRSDIIGARNLGIEAIWLRRTSKKNAAYITSLKEVPYLLND